MHTRPEDLTHKQYPIREIHNSAWEELARHIAESRDSLTEEIPPSENTTPKEGSLLVLGSGIESVGFTRDAEAHIKSADKVFFCVADPPTVVWIKKLRPDAFDLYVLYEDSKVRYHTYMQMTEAMLYYVRQGLHVVAVYYGHPGVFVLSTHRAIAIAQREGYRAVMKAGISALDCLCSDLGVDPSHPGLQTYEATDMLLRGRKLDITMHIVLWQVGLIGEMGYRRRGFINNNFSIFVEYLQSFYGKDYEITHYVAARYPTLPPLIKKYKLSELLEPDIRSTITGLSTFYVPPKEAAPTNMDMAIRLGLAQPGQTPKKSGPLREIARYSPREMRAVDEFRNFKVPHDYQYQDNTRASEFLIELCENIELQNLYISDPQKAVSDEVFPGLSAHEKEMLASREEGKIQLVAKNARVKISYNERLVLQLFRDAAQVQEFSRFIKDHATDPQFEQLLNTWAGNDKGEIIWKTFATAYQNILASMLLPWTGVYCDKQSDLTLTIVGNPGRNDQSAVYVNTSPIKPFIYNNSTLKWRASDGNPNNGILTFSCSVNKQGLLVRTVQGKIWTKDAERPQDILSLEEIRPLPTLLPSWVGIYACEISSDGVEWEAGPALEIAPFSHAGRTTIGIRIHGNEAEELVATGHTITFGNSKLKVGRTHQGRMIAGIIELADKGKVRIKGTLSEHGEYIYGMYAAYRLQGTWKHLPITIEKDTLTIGDQTIHTYRYEQGSILWDTGEGAYKHGQLNISIDPVLLRPCIYGYISENSEEQSRQNIYGIHPGMTEQEQSDRTKEYTMLLLDENATYAVSDITLTVAFGNDGMPAVALRRGDEVVHITHVHYSPESATLAWNEELSTDFKQFAKAELTIFREGQTGIKSIKGRCGEHALPDDINCKGIEGGMSTSPVWKTIPITVWRTLSAISKSTMKSAGLNLFGQWLKTRNAHAILEQRGRKIPAIIQRISQQSN